SPLCATASQAMALTTASSWGGKGSLAAPPRLILQGEVARGPALPPGPDGVGMEPHTGRGLGVGEVRLLVMEEDQFGPLPQLESDGPPPDDASGPIEEVPREIGAVRGERTGPGANPVAAIAASIRSPRSLPGAGRVPKPYSYF